MDFADLAINTVAPWSIVAVVVIAIFRMINSGKLIPEKSADLRDALMREQVSLMKERLNDKDAVITAGLAREELQRMTIEEQTNQLRVLAGLTETTNRALRALPKPLAGDHESA